jgi:hypothetical protein
VLTTDQKGAVAEAKIAAAPLELGIGVWRPLADEPADLIFGVGESFLRIQCKWASLYRGVIVIRGATIQLRLDPTRNSQQRRIRGEGL